jgi:hypothetical protein
MQKSRYVTNLNASIAWRNKLRDFRRSTSADEGHDQRLSGIRRPFAGWQPCGMVAAGRLSHLERPVLGDGRLGYRLRRRLHRGFMLLMDQNAAVVSPKRPTPMVPSNLPQLMLATWSLAGPCHSDPPELASPPGW